MKTIEMPVGGIVSQAEWVKARAEFLAKEKEFTRLRDDLARQRRELPWARVEQEYEFEGPDGPESLADLFEGRSQLVVYHFMLGPGWEEGCPGCSFVSDHFDGAIAHLNARDVTLVVVSRAPLSQIRAFQQRMGWKFKWVSSAESEFNFDYGVSFTKEQVASKKVPYNYGVREFPKEEAPGMSVFYRSLDGDIFHTYSTYGRGLDPFVGAYQFLDIVPKGRDEDGLPSPMAWLKHHDRYPSSTVSSAIASAAKAMAKGTCCSGGKDCA